MCVWGHSILGVRNPGFTVPLNLRNPGVTVPLDLRTLRILLAPLVLRRAPLPPPPPPSGGGGVRGAGGSGKKVFFLGCLLRVQTPQTIPAPTDENWRGNALVLKTPVENAPRISIEKHLSWSSDIPPAARFPLHRSRPAKYQPNRQPATVCAESGAESDDDEVG
jgi:hypothetical protein